MPKFSQYIVYVDESGDHGVDSMASDSPVFVLAFCIFRKTDYSETITPLLQQFKFEHFGHDMVVLHEREIRKTEGPFQILFDKSVRDRFMSGLSQIMTDAPFTLVASYVRKDSFRDNHGEDEILYHVAVRSCLPRVYRFLVENNAENAITHMIFEARGKKEDNELELEFRRVCDGDNADRKNLPFSIILATKHVNSCGLQIADLVARPIGRKFLKPSQQNRAYDILATTFHDNNGDINGLGLEIIP